MRRSTARSRASPQVGKWALRHSQGGDTGSNPAGTTRENAKPGCAEYPSVTAKTLASSPRQEPRSCAPTSSAERPSSRSCPAADSPTSRSERRSSRDSGVRIIPRNAPPHPIRPRLDPGTSDRGGNGIRQWCGAPSEGPLELRAIDLPGSLGLIELLLDRTQRGIEQGRLGCASVRTY